MLSPPENLLGSRFSFFSSLFLSRWRIISFQTGWGPSHSILFSEGGGHFLSEETSCCGLKRNQVDGSRAQCPGGAGLKIIIKKNKEPFSGVLLLLLFSVLLRSSYYFFYLLVPWGPGGERSFLPKPSREKGFLFLQTGHKVVRKKERWRRIPR